MSTHSPQPARIELPSTVRIGILAARFNAAIVDELLAGCISRLEELGLNGDRVEVCRVPGAFELPLAAQALARTGRVAAVICLGCVVRGDTPHFDFVAGEAARGIQQVGLLEHLPVIFGVLTTDTEQQAWDRAGGKHGHAGRNAAEAAVEMAAMMGELGNTEGSNDEPL
jgi:6,7-dimethyl-8-ribityllumazine synthase